MRKSIAVLFLVIAAAFPFSARSADTAGSSGEHVETIPLPGGAIRERVYRGSALVEERVVDATGALLKETFFAVESSTEDGEAAILEIWNYLRSKTGRLQRVDIRDSKGEILGTREYRYDSIGRLLGVSLSGSTGSESSGMLSSGGPPQGAWVSTPSSTTTLAYDERGRPTALQTIRDGSVVLVERRIYGEGPFPIRIETENKASESKTVAEYDAATGRSTVKIELRSGRETARTAYSYDEAGRLVEETSRDVSGNVTKRILTYDTEGTLRREESRYNGLILAAVEYLDEGRIEELYRGGELFVKATYREGRKVKDEFFSKGEKLREKEYK
jgi:antitoxin component YwqK of YwqJK toxin-antitoxin module